MVFLLEDVTPAVGGGMSNFVTKIGETISSANLWTEVTPIAVVVGVLVLFKLGYNTLKKNVNNATRTGGKAMK